jgi:uncharacterized protein (DUF2126 family)
VDEGVALVGLRYRAYAPARGLHPDVAPHVPIGIVWWREGEHRATSIAMHDWKPGGGAYDGLPASDEEAHRRRVERFVVAPAVPPRDVRGARGAGERYTFDLRE